MTTVKILKFTKFVIVDLLTDSSCNERVVLQIFSNQFKELYLLLYIAHILYDAGGKKKISWADVGVQHQHSLCDINLN